jgi:hypothetical protein
MRTELPSAKFLNSLLDYDPATGRLIWRIKPGQSKVEKIFNTRYARKEPGAFNTCGHRQLRINGRLTLAHRIIWKMMTGLEPPNHLDHIDGNPSNNRWINLRAATSCSNTWNRKTNQNNTSGYPCIYRMHTKLPTSKKFRVLMMSNGRRKLVGDFHTIEQAKAAYETAFDKYRDSLYKRTTT